MLDFVLMSDESIAKAHNGFTKFMIRMLQIIILAILESIILGSIIALVSYCYNTFNPILFKLASIIIGIGLVFGYIIYIMTDNPSNYIPDKLENDDNNDTVNSETKKDDTLEDKYNDSTKRMVSAIAI